MSHKREAEEDKGGYFSCAGWSHSGVAAQRESDHSPCVWAARAAHPKGLLFAFCTDLIKLLEKMNPCDRCPLQGEMKSPEGGEASQVCFWKRPNAPSGLPKPHLGWRQYACFIMVPLLTS